MSFFSIVICFGAKKRNVMILVISVRMLNKINPITARRIDFLIKIGKTKIIKRILMICSIILETVFGIIRWRPKKYPFRIEEMLMNGNVRVMAISK